MKSLHGFLIVYSITNRSSFDEVPFFIEKIAITRYLETEKIPFIIIGNKCDLEKEREISIQEGTELEKHYSCPFFLKQVQN